MERERIKTDFFFYLVFPVSLSTLSGEDEFNGNMLFSARVKQSLYIIYFSLIVD